MRSIYISLVLFCTLIVPELAKATQFSFQAFWESQNGKSREVVALGVAASEYQTAFDMFKREGLELFLVDGYDMNGQNYMNFVFRKATGKKWAARHGMTGRQYQKAFDKYVRDGKYRLRWVDSYRQGNSIRYAAIFSKNQPRMQTAYHGYTARQHQDRFNSLTSKGWSPVNVSVVSIKGRRYYTAFYEKYSGGFLLKSFLTRDQFEAIHAKQKKAKYGLAYMNAYTYDKNQLPRFVAIWRPNHSGEYLPNVYGPTAMEKGQNLVDRGYHTKFIAGYGVGTGHRFDTFWFKPKRKLQTIGKMKIKMK